MTSPAPDIPRLQKQIKAVVDKCLQLARESDGSRATLKDIAFEGMAEIRELLAREKASVRAEAGLQLAEDLLDLLLSTEARVQPRQRRN